MNYHQFFANKREDDNVLGLEFSDEMQLKIFLIKCLGATIDYTFVWRTERPHSDALALDIERWLRQPFSADHAAIDRIDTLLNCLFNEPRHSSALTDIALCKPDCLSVRNWWESVCKLEYLCSVWQQDIDRSTKLLTSDLPTKEVVASALIQADAIVRASRLSETLDERNATFSMSGSWINPPHSSGKESGSDEGFPTPA